MNTMLSLAWRNLWRHKRRTWLTVGAMVFSNILLVFMIALQLGNYETMIDNSLKAYSGQLQVSIKGYHDEPKMRSVITNINTYAERIRNAMPELTVTTRAETFVLASSEERSFGLQIAGVDIEHERNISSIPGLVNDGDYLGSGDHQEIVIGKVLARNLKVDVGDEITLLGSAIDGSFAAAVVTVRGIFESGISDLDRSLAQMSLDSFQSLFLMPNSGHTITINGDDVADAEYYQQRIQTLLSVVKNSQGDKNESDQTESVNDELETLNWQELNPGLQQAIQSDMASAWFLYGVLILLVSFSVLNTQLMSVLERTREFGIMMAIGLRPVSLSRLVLFETSAMASLGFIIGTTGGLALALYLNQVGFSIPGMEDMAAQYNLSEKMYPAISFISILTGPLAVFVGCLLAAVYPVIRLQSLQPVAAMRAV